jgi:hypothetical protein
MVKVNCVKHFWTHLFKHYQSLHKIGSIIVVIIIIIIAILQIRKLRLRVH